MSCCHVLVRLGASGVLDTLNKDQAFFTHVQDHDETDEDAMLRLANIRAELIS
jgi:hypothetical protein